MASTYPADHPGGRGGSGRLGSPLVRVWRNFPIQANAAEMFRWAVIYTVEAGLPLVLLMHDAVLIHAPLRDIDEVVHETRGVYGEGLSHNPAR